MTTRGFSGAAAIADIGATGFSEDSGRTEWRLACECVLAALADAGIGADEVDGAALYDAFMPMVLLQLEEHGFCGIGEPKGFVAEGDLEVDARLPVNTHGGQLGEGYIHGVNGIAEGPADPQHVDGPTREAARARARDRRGGSPPKSSRFSWRGRRTAHRGSRRELDGPVSAARRVMERTGTTIGGFDLFEVNEAFAAVPMSFGRVHRLEEDRLNANGGAIAIGHPVGSTGIRLIATIVDELGRRDKTLGMVAVCAGGAMATGSVIERI